MKMIWAWCKTRGSSGGRLHGERRATSGRLFGEANPILVQRIYDDPQIGLAFTGYFRSEIGIYLSARNFEGC